MTPQRDAEGPSAGLRLGTSTLFVGLIVVLAGLLLLAPSSAATDTVDEFDKLIADDGGDNDWLGSDVSLDGERALVGAMKADNDDGVASGAAYIYVGDAGSWSQAAKLVSDDGEDGDDFGDAVAIDNGVALVGAPFDDNTNGLNAGAVYVFEDDGTGTWTQQAKLLPDDGEAEDRFGSALSLDGNRALIGAEQGDNGTGVETGAAYVFEDDGTGTWTQQAKLLPDDGEAGDRFGSALSLDGNRALIGSLDDDNTNGQDAGSAYVYRESSGSWSQQAKLVASDGAAGDRFGSAVSLDGARGVVGAEDADGANGIDAGKAYVFEDDGTGTWIQQAILAAGDGGSSDRFGSDVGLDGDTAVVGARFADDATGADTGAAYLYAHDAGSWSEETKVLASDAEAGDRMGAAASLDGNVTLLGAFADDNTNGQDAGGAYLYTPAPPEDLRATAGSQEDVIELDWSPPSDAKQSFTYHVKRAQQSGGPYQEIATTTDPAYTDTGVDQTYAYVVTAESSDGLESQPSNEASAHPRPEAPTGLTAEQGDQAGEIEVSWEASPDDDGTLSYRVFRSTQDGGPYKFVHETGSTAYEDTDLRNRTYYYVVTTVDGDDVESPLSEQAEADAALDPTDVVTANQNDAATGGDASDDPDDPTVLAGGQEIEINGSLVPVSDPVDAYGTRISVNSTTNMSFDFVAPAGMSLHLRLLAPDGSLVDEGQAPAEGGPVGVEVQAGPGEHLAEGIWTIVLEHGLQPDVGSSPVSSSDIPAVGTDGVTAGVDLGQTPVDDVPPRFQAVDYDDERQCDPRC